MSDVEQCKHPNSFWSDWWGVYLCSLCGDALNTQNTAPAFDCHFSDIRKEIEAYFNGLIENRPAKHFDVLVAIGMELLAKLDAKYGRSK